MRPIILVAALSAAAGSMLLAQGPPRDRASTPAPTGTAAIAGRITVQGARPVVPVRRARVMLQSDALGQSKTTDADTDGRYRFDDLPPGAYRVTAEKPGFVTLGYGAARAWQQPETLDVKNGESLAADIALPRGASIEGRLVNEEGEPIQNVVVSAVRLAYTPAGRRPSAVRQARTDDLGRYRIHSLPPGEYYVDAAADPLRAADAVVVPGARQPGLARTYFPGTAQIHEARRVSLAIGQNIPDVSFALGSVPLATVAIQVVDSAGKPVARHGLRIQRVGGAPGEVAGFAGPAPGTSLFRSVPPGDYWVMAAHVPADGVKEFAVTRLTVAGQDISDVTLTTSRGAVVNGRVEADGEGFVADAVSVMAHETEFELPNPRPGAPLEPVRVAADGRFEIAGLFGPRVIRVAGLPGAWAVRRISWGDADITDRVTDFKGGNAPQAMRILVTNKTGTVVATVTDARGRFVAGARVVAFSENEGLWGSTSRFVKASRARRDGVATIDGLLPGTYLIGAVEDLDEGAWYDPDVLRGLRAAASTITVREQDTQKVTLKLKVQS